MAISPPESRVWWNDPVSPAELIWIAIAFLWGVIMFFMMVYWHLEGEQNVSTEVYRIDPAVYQERVDDFADTYRLHLSSLDWQHGFSLQPDQHQPADPSGLIEMVITLTPTESGRVRYRVQRILRHRPSHSWWPATSSAWSTLAAGQRREQ
jgi:cytochrome c oxidase subunit II